MAKTKSSGARKPDQTLTDRIMAFGDISAPEVVDALAKQGIKTTVASVYSTRHRVGKKKEKEQMAKAKTRVVKKKKKTPRTAKAVRQPARRKVPTRKTRRTIRDLRPDSTPDNGEVLRLKMDLAAERARREVLEQHLTDNE